MRVLSYQIVLACALLYGCVGQPLSDVEPAVDDPDWRVHCETDKTYTLDLKAIPGIYHGHWLWAESSPGEVIYLRGQLDGGFFLLDSVISESGESLLMEESDLRKYCLETIARDEPRELARVLAARDSRDLDVPIIFPDQESEPGQVSRLVVFGDSLSDAGRLKHRMQVFPGSPYWLGRFSNGPVWTDYLETTTTLAIQNRSYGGASINPPQDIDESGLIGFVKDEGRFFVSGSLADQVSSYLEDQRSTPGIDSPGITAHLIWAGANDYISKEPITGLITTFLNTTRGELGYKSVVEDTVAGILEQVRVLYRSGARRFLVVNMPDLGLTPIVLQNDSYNSGLGLKSDIGRRFELSRRLSILSEYHNEVLASSVEDLQSELSDAEILPVDSHAMSGSILTGRLFTDQNTAFDYGFTLGPLQQTLEYDDRTIDLQNPCYSGIYLGSLNDNEVCEIADSVFFWDVIHPSSFTHCWQAYLVGVTLSDAGWTEPLPGLEQHRTWCQTRANETSSSVQPDT